MLKVKRLISSFFVLIALTVLLIGRVLPHHHHVEYIAGNGSGITVVHFGVHCHDDHTCEHGGCNHHNHSEASCPGGENIVFEQCKIEYTAMPVVQPTLFWAPCSLELPVIGRTICSNRPIYINPKIPDEASHPFALRAPPCSPFCA